MSWGSTFEGFTDLVLGEPELLVALVPEDVEEYRYVVVPLLVVFLRH
jgi:hypothetical protein